MSCTKASDKKEKVPSNVAGQARIWKQTEYAFGFWMGAALAAWFQLRAAQATHLGSKPRQENEAWLCKRISGVPCYIWRLEVKNTELKCDGAHDGNAEVNELLQHSQGDAGVPHKEARFADQQEVRQVYVLFLLRCTCSHIQHFS